MQTEAVPGTLGSDCSSFDELVRACASIIARVVVSLCAGDILSDKSTSVPVDVVIELMVYIALFSLTRWIIHRRNERGGWAPWIGSVLRGLIVADERQHHWMSPAFNIVEGQITPSLICPITMGLVCVLYYY
jgi:hypothetical protein